MCSEYRDDLDYIAGWRAWYTEIDREGTFWTEEAQKKASKHGLQVGNAFGGLFLFDCKVQADSSVVCRRDLGQRVLEKPAHCIGMRLSSSMSSL